MSLNKNEENSTELFQLVENYFPLKIQRKFTNIALFLVMENGSYFRVFVRETTYLFGICASYKDSNTF